MRTGASRYVHASPINRHGLSIIQPYFPISRFYATLALPRSAFLSAAVLKRTRDLFTFFPVWGLLIRRINILTGVQADNNSEL